MLTPSAHPQSSLRAPHPATAWQTIISQGLIPFSVQVSTNLSMYQSILPDVLGILARSRRKYFFYFFSLALAWLLVSEASEAVSELQL